MSQLDPWVPRYVFLVGAMELSPGVTGSANELKTIALRYILGN